VVNFEKNVWGPIKKTGDENKDIPLNLKRKKTGGGGL